MRYYELLMEAPSQEYWNHIFGRAQELVKDLPTDPQAVLVECEETARFLASTTPADDEEAEIIEIAIASYNDLIEQAERIIDQQQQP